MSAPAAVKRGQKNVVEHQQRSCALTQRQSTTTSGNSANSSISITMPSRDHVGTGDEELNCSALADGENTVPVTLINTTSTTTVDEDEEAWLELFHQRPRINSLAEDRAALRKWLRLLLAASYPQRFADAARTTSKSSGQVSSHQNLSSNTTANLSNESLSLSSDETDQQASYDADW